MVAVAVGDAADEGGDDDLRALAADGQDSVVEDAVVAPAGEGFLLRFGEAEIDFSAPELFYAVVFAGLEELVGADEAQSAVAVGGHCVLSAFAAGEGEEGAAHAEVAGESCEQRAVLVVGVGDDHHQAGGGGEALEGLLEGSGAAVFSDGQGDGVGLAGRELDGQGSGGGRRRRLLRWQAHRESACKDEGGKDRSSCGSLMLIGEEHTFRQCTIRGA